MAGFGSAPVIARSHRGNECLFCRVGLGPEIGDCELPLHFHLSSGSLRLL